MVIKTYNFDGVEISFSTWDHPYLIGDYEFKKGKLDFIKSFLKEGDIVLDIGSHCGEEAMMYGIAVGKTGSVYAFEPNPSAFKRFQESCQLNSHKVNVVPIMKAATEEDGKFIFHYSDPFFCNGGFASKTEAGIGACGHSFELEVEGINLSNWANTVLKEDVEKISFIKIDSEGYDYFILKSLVPLISRARPIIQSEIFVALSETEIKRHLDFFDEIGYSTYLMSADKQEALGYCDIFKLREKPIDSASSRRLKIIKYGEDILSIPKEKLL